MQKAYTVEYNEDFGRYEIVRWTHIKNGVRSGTTIDRFYVEQDAHEVCEFYNDTELPDIGCEFDGRYDEQFELDFDYN